MVLATQSPAGETRQAEPPSSLPRAEADPSPTAVDATAGTGRRRRRLLIVCTVVTALIVATGGATVLVLRGDVPRGTTVLGLELGGKSRGEAAAALRTHLAGRATQLTDPVTVQVAGSVGTVRPADVGLHIDVDASVAAAARGRPQLFGSREVQPVSIVDPQRLDAALRKSLGSAGEQMRMPAIVFDGTTPRPVYPQAGRGLDARRSADSLREGWLSQAPVAIPLVEVAPATTREEVDQLMSALARPAVSAPVTVTSERGNLTISPTVIAQSLTLAADSTGKITPRIDDEALRKGLTGQLSRLETAPRDARFTFTGGRPRITDGADGSALDLAALAPQLLSVLAKATDRTVAAAARTVGPKATTAKLEGLGVRERVSTFTTKFPGGLSSPRSQNIVQIAKEVDGALVMPGKVFSLNKHTGERSYAQGYKDAPVILNGKLTPGVGGGASQFTTTLFNATYYAGLQDVEHKPHSYWFSRYPPVIESTIFYPDLDFKFKNNTPHGVYLDTSYTSSTITVSVWSTKVYEKVTTEWGPRRNTTTPRRIELKAGPSCIATDGINGFTQDAYRLFHSGGKVVKREKFTWTYGAEPQYVCTDSP
ncbi:vanomycin resistance protein VanB [Actinoplanes sp. ATCC 53533]|uniref:VanW family protein n=1 Tax=Actinoplanes sp. ATCC 53533 TaxID=1288362 RepID=UPI000F7A08A1|nr:VanW family protein [Actinoplanes sp. ATCC 53533]RSM56843.1 vanomycin resistance protein VanB [Actinoplanes sp. ATCC 53533]